MGWEYSTELEEGIEKTYAWFLENIENIKKLKCKLRKFNKKNNMKVALITGITGQDGSYLAELLLEKGYMVHGLKEDHPSLILTELIIYIKIHIIRIKDLNCIMEIYPMQ